MNEIPIELFTIILTLALVSCALAFLPQSPGKHATIDKGSIFSLVSMFLFFTCGYSFYLGISVQRAETEIYTSGSVGLFFIALGACMAMVLVKKVFDLYQSQTKGFTSDFKSDF